MPEFTNDKVNKLRRWLRSKKGKATVLSALKQAKHQYAEFRKASEAEPKIWQETIDI